MKKSWEWGGRHLHARRRRAHTYAENSGEQQAGTGGVGEVTATKPQTTNQSNPTPSCGVQPCPRYRQGAFTKGKSKKKMKPATPKPLLAKNK